MKQMIYDRNQAKLLHKGVCKGFEFYIISYGTHPCAYVRIPEDHRLYQVDYFDYTKEIDVNCHGGITWSKEGLYRSNPINVDRDGWWIGWDYHHFGDYDATYETSHDCEFYGDKRWTTEEIYSEVVYVCEQLREMNGESR